MLTLKHFMDRPVWAAVAGYDFNYLDCMAYVASMACNPVPIACDLVKDFFNLTIIELVAELCALLGAIAVTVILPLMFWFFAIPLWLRCTQMQLKYQDGHWMTEIAKGNLAGWIERVNKGV